MVISSLSAGGAERVLVLLAKGLTALGHRVSVVTIFGKDHDFYPLPDGVDRVALDLGKTTRGPIEKITTSVKRISAIRRALRRIRPDVVLSFMPETNVLVLLASTRLKLPVIVTEHNDPRRRRIKRPWRFLRRICYRRASRLVSVSAGVDDCFPWLPEAKRAVIYNPICLAEVRSEAGKPLPFDSPRTVIAVGRLEPQKGFDLLVDAFARVAADFPLWGLLILGEGSERPRLQSLIATRRMTARARLPGTLGNPFPTLKKADLFVLSSRYEGFGIALVEAMACGVAAIATDCRSGPGEIVRHGVDGILVPPEDVDALAAAMADLMADEARRRQLASQAAESAKRFDLAQVARTWDQLLRELVAREQRG
jgi:GalNAc-alpha-(1->4)-GalNAc-alpha-(1->3)-diNAcBac-PP-undecaprenol alpha-1,4-N-acetyl-D-galactosaminyltransferase